MEGPSHREEAPQGDATTITNAAAESSSGQPVTPENTPNSSLPPSSSPAFATLHILPIPFQVPRVTMASTGTQTEHSGNISTRTGTKRSFRAAATQTLPVSRKDWTIGWVGGKSGRPKKCRFCDSTGHRHSPECNNPEFGPQALIRYPSKAPAVPAPEKSLEAPTVPVLAKSPEVTTVAGPEKSPEVTIVESLTAQTSAGPLTIDLVSPAAAEEQDEIPVSTFQGLMDELARSVEQGPPSSGLDLSWEEVLFMEVPSVIDPDNSAAAPEGSPPGGDVGEVAPEPSTSREYQLELSAEEQWYVERLFQDDE